MTVFQIVLGLTGAAASACSENVVLDSLLSRELGECSSSYLHQHYTEFHIARNLMNQIPSKSAAL